jgi:hypothetical protein
MRRDGKAARPFTRRDLHWADRYPDRLAVSTESHHFGERHHIG